MTAESAESLGSAETAPNQDEIFPRLTPDHVVTVHQVGGFSGTSTCCPAGRSS